MTPAGPNWTALPLHHRWLRHEADRLLSFYEQVYTNSGGRFPPLGLNGEPTPGYQDLYAVARLVHCFSVAHLLGRPGAANIVNHGLDTIKDAFEDTNSGGWYSAIAADGHIVDETKDAYAHAFLLLAASSAAQAGFTGGHELLAQVAAIVDEHFWQEREGASVSAYTHDWELIEPDYRGQNANMHLAEAFMAAFEATSDRTFLFRAGRIADTLINNHAREWGWRLPEHFNGSWIALPNYNFDKPTDAFRPRGALVGHWLEWARLIVQLHALDSTLAPWAPDAAMALFDAAVTDGWDAQRTGFVYSVDFDGHPINEQRMHWTVAEAVGAASWLGASTGNVIYEEWYRTFWDHIACFVIDRIGGSWWHELDSSGRPTFTTWRGKPDLYHAYQATLYARAGYDHGLADAARRGQIQ